MRPPPEPSKPPIWFRMLMIFVMYFGILLVLFVADYEVPEQPSLLEILGIVAVVLSPILIPLGFYLEYRNRK